VRKSGMMLKWNQLVKDRRGKLLRILLLETNRKELKILDPEILLMESCPTKKWNQLLRIDLCQSQTQRQANSTAWMATIQEEDK
jgi:hypothetical protein